MVLLTNIAMQNINFVTEQVGFNPLWSETPRTGFLATRPIFTKTVLSDNNIFTLVNVYVDLLVFTRIACTS